MFKEERDGIGCRSVNRFQFNRSVSNSRTYLTVKIGMIIFLSLCVNSSFALLHFDNFECAIRKIATYLYNCLLINIWMFVVYLYCRLFLSSQTFPSSSFSTQLSSPSSSHDIPANDNTRKCCFSLLLRMAHINSVLFARSLTFSVSVSLWYSHDDFPAAKKYIQ